MDFATFILEYAGKKGFEYERKFVNRLNKHGLMNGSSPGTSQGTDFHLHDNRNNHDHLGKVSETLEEKDHPSTISGETKRGLNAAFGQLTLHHHPKRGWHIPEHKKITDREFAKAIEKATVTVGGVKKKFLKHINDSMGAPGSENEGSRNILSDESDLEPMHGYLRDKNVDLLHVGSHGTFRAGYSDKKDRTTLGLPKAVGRGRFRVREKHPGTRTVQFGIRVMNPSKVNIDKDEDLEKIKKKLGHGDKMVREDFDKNSASHVEPNNSSNVGNGSEEDQDDTITQKKGSFLQQILKRLAAAKKNSSALDQGGMTMTGEIPNEIVVNPDVLLRKESRELCPKCGRAGCKIHGRK